VEKVRLFNALFEKLYPLYPDTKELKMNAFGTLKNKQGKEKKVCWASKFIFLTFSFSLKEWHQLNMEFYQRFDQDKNIQLSFDEILPIFEMMA